MIVEIPRNMNWNLINHMSCLRCFRDCSLITCLCYWVVLIMIVTLFHDKSLVRTWALCTLLFMCLFFFHECTPSCDLFSRTCDRIYFESTCYDLYTWYWYDRGMIFVNHFLPLFTYLMLFHCLKPFEPYCLFFDSSTNTYLAHYLTFPYPGTRMISLLFLSVCEISMGWGAL